MKVILLRDVAKIGRRFEVKEVPDGYALNQLIPKKYAELATKTAIKQIAERERKGQINTNLEREKLLMLVESCQSEPLEITMEANEQGHLFQAVNAKDIKQVASLRNFAVVESSIHFKTPIKSLGPNEAFIDMGGEKFSVALNVVAKNK